MPLSDRSSYGEKNHAWNRRLLGLSSGAGIFWKLLQGRNRKWCLEIHAPCLIFDIIRQSCALPLVRTGNARECQLTCAHATFLWYFLSFCIVSSPCGSVWLYMAADNWLFTLVSWPHNLKREGERSVHGSYGYRTYLIYLFTGDHSLWLLCSSYDIDTTIGLRVSALWERG